MHLDVNEIDNNFIEDKPSFDNFVYEDKFQYLRVLKNGGELFLIGFAFPSLQIVVNSEYSPMLFQKNNDCFIGRSKDLYFNQNSEYDILKNLITLFVNKKNLHIQLKFDCKKSINCASKSASKSIKTCYSRKDPNANIGFWSSIFGVSEPCFNFYRLDNNIKLNDEVCYKIEPKCDKFSLLCDDNKKLIEIQFYKESDAADYLLKFWHIPKYLFAFEIESATEPEASVSKKEVCVDISYSMKERNIESIYNNYGKDIATKIFGHIKFKSYLLYKFLNKYLHNDSISVLMTYELLLFAFFLLILLIFIVIKKFVSKEQFRFRKTDAMFVNDNNSKLNTRLQIALMVVNIPMFYIFAMCIPSTWAGIKFVDSIVCGATLSHTDFVLFNAVYFFVSPGRIMLWLSFVLSWLPNIFFNKEQKILNEIRKVAIFAFIFSLYLVKVGNPIMYSIFFSMLFLNKMFIFLALRLIFNIPLKMV